MVCREIEAHGGVAKEFNTIAVDDRIAMGRRHALQPAIAEVMRMRWNTWLMQLRRCAGVYLQL